MNKTSRKSIIWTTIAATTLIAAILSTSITTNTANAAHTFGGTYVIDIIPGAAQKDSLYHYFPAIAAVPAGTEIAWFNGDSAEPHTVTSGIPGDENVGMLFNSGVMSYQYFFHREFQDAGDYTYHCIIHPWRFGLVHVSDDLKKGNNFEFTSGTGSMWSVSDFDRNLLKFEPTTVAVEPTQAATYYFTIFDGNRTVYEGYFSSSSNLMLELISSDYERTVTYGPDRGSTGHSFRGAYHVQGNFIEPDTTYTISIALTSIEGKLLDDIPFDQFPLHVAP